MPNRGYAPIIQKVSTAVAILAVSRLLQFPQTLKIATRHLINDHGTWVLSFVAKLRGTAVTIVENRTIAPSGHPS